MQQSLFSNWRRGLLAAAAASMLLMLEVPLLGQQQPFQGGAQFGPGPRQGIGVPSPGMGFPQMGQPGQSMQRFGQPGFGQSDFQRPRAPQMFGRQDQPFGDGIQDDRLFDSDRFRRTPRERLPQEHRTMRPETFDGQRDRVFDGQFGRDERLDRSFDVRARGQQEFGGRQDFDRQQDFGRERDFNGQGDFELRQDFDRREVQRQDTARRDGRGATTTRIESAADLGLSVSQSQRDRLVIRDVRRNSLAARAGLRPGDVILAVNRQPVTAFRDFDAFLARTDFFVQPVPILVLRDGFEEVVFIRPAAYGRYEADLEQVDALDNYFRPAVLRIRPGATVRWTNRGRHSHTVTAEDHSWDSGELYPGESVTFTFHQPGSYYYYCRYHTRDRMEGVVLVGESGSRASGGGPSY